LNPPQFVNDNDNDNDNVSDNVSDNVNDSDIRDKCHPRHFRRQQYRRFRASWN